MKKGLRFIVPNDNCRVDAVILIGDQVKTYKPCGTLQMRKEFALRALDGFLESFAIDRSTIVYMGTPSSAKRCRLVADSFH